MLRLGASISRHVCFYCNAATTSNLYQPSHSFPLLSTSTIPSVVEFAPQLQQKVELPALEKCRLYSFPDILPRTLEVPSTTDARFLLPGTGKILELPPHNAPLEVLAAPRLLTIRRKKMKKHKRKKRYDRDWAKYQKYHREKKLKAERQYEKRMKAHLKELEAFNPEEYVQSVLVDSKKTWQKELAPTGRKLYPHWSRVITIEELYGLPKSDFIDKRAGLPSEEDAAKLFKQQEEYRKVFRGEADPSKQKTSS